jgi:hypothetical protein
MDELIRKGPNNEQQGKENEVEGRMMPGWDGSKRRMTKIGDIGSIVYR